MSLAYEEWVRSTRTRLNFAITLGILRERGDSPAKETMISQAYDVLTKENKKRRLLFAKGRKEPVGRARKIR